MMKTIRLLLTAFLLFTGVLTAQTYRKHRVNIKPLSATKFELTDVNFQNPHIVDLSGKDFFVVSVREPGSDGQVYAVDRDGTIWWHGKISSGAGGGHLKEKNGKFVPVGGHETNNNLFHVLAKRRFHMSKTHPDPSGVNNMDFEVQFTPDGQALHLGHTAAMSHGCIHVGRQDISALFKWAKVGMPVVVMRGHYSQFLHQEVDQFKNDVREYDAKRGVKSN
ncbi:L,D-transpeptidase [Sulfurovum sp.]|uniref:L,D-transpeptidase n=2 Tax=Sulfurovum sp. TaxID=1969726 RepID=UPI0025D51AE0|nr:L,D-transpeptidase [Sulfurovum sp.]